MKCKPTRAAIDAARIAPRQRSFLQSSLRRALDTAQKSNLPISRVDISRDGTLSLVVGKAEPEKINDLDNWMAKHANETEGH